MKYHQLDGEFPLLLLLLIIVARSLQCCVAECNGADLPSTTDLFRSCPRNLFRFLLRGGPAALLEYQESIIPRYSIKYMSYCSAATAAARRGDDSRSGVIDAVARLCTFH